MTTYIDETVKQGSDFRVGHNVIIEEGVVFGNHVTIGHNVVIYGDTRFGDNVMIMDNCVIGKQPHPPFREHEVFKIEEMPPAKFGSNIVLGTGGIIYAGSEIGDYLYTADDVIIRERCSIGPHVSIGKKAIVEHHVNLGEGTKIQSYGLVGEGMKVGKHVFVGPFFNGTSDKFMDRIEERVFEPPIIKDYARLGGHTVLLAGKTIGTDAAVGAGAVITKDVPDYSVVTGVPARVLKEIPVEQRHEKVKGV